METQEIVKNVENGDSYIARNRGYITASKLKVFDYSPELYFRMYVLEIKPTYEKEEERHFIIGNALDFALSYGLDKFHGKYKEVFTVPKKKEELVALAISLDPSFNIFTGEIQANGKAKEKTVEVIVDELSKILDDGRTELTKGEMKLVMALYDEALRQPLMKATSKDYEVQVEYIADYGSLKLKATLDRLSHTLGEIRDWKSTGERDFIRSFRNYGYDLSMVLYWLMVYINEGKDYDLYLDTLYKSTPSCGIVYKIDKGYIQPVLERLKILLDRLEDMTNRYNETKDENIWKEGNDITRLIGNEYWDKLESTIQITENIIY